MTFREGIHRGAEYEGHDRGRPARAKPPHRSVESASTSISGKSALSDMDQGGFFFEVDFHVEENTLQLNVSHAANAWLRSSSDNAVFDGLVVFAHQHRKPLSQLNHIRVDTAFAVLVGWRVIVAKGNALKLGQSAK